MVSADDVRVKVRVKVCGITRPDDAERAIRLGADALGFNFYAKSTRYLGDLAGLGWLRELPPLVQRVGVCVNPPSPEWVRGLRDQGLVDSIQLHGDEDEEFCRAVLAGGAPLIRALRVRDATSLVRPERFGTRTLLLDAHQPGAYGGTGERFDWVLAERFVEEQPRLQVILSGGLTPENVAEAVRRVRPYAVDVASGVEDANDPRRKDFAKMRDFLQAVARI